VICYVQSMRFVDLETAKASSGVRLVMLKGAPSPWSQAAKAIFQVKGVDVLGVWSVPGDQALRAWTGVPNAPVVVFDQELPRSHWADILALAERIAPSVPLVPDDIDERVRAFGLCNEIMGQGGLVWCMRLSLVELSLTSQGTRGYSTSIAQYLGARYGYTKGCGAAADARIVDILTALEAQLQRGGPYYFGSQVSALDIYSAAAMDTLAPLSEADCPMHPKTRAAFESRRDAASFALPQGLLAHRDHMHREHMPLPIVC
jgi:glutathione S-transferase